MAHGDYVPTGWRYWRQMTDEEWDKNKPVIERHIAPLFERIAALEQQVTRLEAGMTWLRDYAIGGAIALHTAQHDGELSNERVEQIIGGIEGNIAVAMDRASAKGEDDGA